MQRRSREQIRGNFSFPSVASGHRDPYEQILSWVVSALPFRVAGITFRRDLPTRQIRTVPSSRDSLEDLEEKRTGPMGRAGARTAAWIERESAAGEARSWLGRELRLGVLVGPVRSDRV